jgi:8-oxo-dGTP pyrophosphatase MutT (NUDIX family)
VIELTGIGGAVEEVDASLSAGAMREAREEIGCSVRLIPCQRAIIVRSRDDIGWLAMQGRERPAAVVFRNYRTPPHKPWHEDNQGEACLIVFLAELKGRPWPAMELPSLIWLDPAQILETARYDVPLGRLLSTGAELIVGGAGPPPKTSRVRLTDSQEALALALGDEAPSFYESLG